MTETKTCPECGKNAVAGVEGSALRWWCRCGYKDYRAPSDMSREFRSLDERWEEANNNVSDV